ncbi:hypothetical protein COW99_05185 [Candidatus Roizmanbacteria bacterium CG22_combo_CG10-13_8_21_14_all_38_20]|uniref:Sodium/calcium exchanger membrane region domain-containing protein n=1 Tax=Candidatus Roizmanbacteria bacterium CG22_combo_CG10-13_8_21_14_all_38_20 TaxID=1974862 RepID=A0A2H0BW11_9BACT|nr:sodium:calcium antiporter [Candidatus Microgenomates bacterium]PIP61158.1 MAG: hypothetical protein COW99_05185 [Candidatus Roizmanbacteria bacterium CG22_combo_CG10-13_8_21_14_all_38_20]PJC31148.1 MAG: hypothetical protein CO050_03850 [Candidatus Roizmanbacteria bacterium CG_4_9_14_0_2_um_filter_38_17]
MTLLYFALLVILSLLLIQITSKLIVYLSRLNNDLKIGGFALAGFLLALATSLPELFVGIASALEGTPAISLGNVIGSNIANLTIVAGLAALFGGTLVIKNGTTKQDLLHTFIAGASPLVLLLDKELTRVDAIILIALYGIYNYTLLTKRQMGYEGRESGIALLFRRLQPKRTKQTLRMVFLAVAGIFITSDLIVRLAQAIAGTFHIPVFLIGLFVVALGTSLPELAFEYQAIKKRKGAMFLGNLMGSVVANGTLIIGITALIHPIKIVALSEYLVASIFFVGAFFIFYIMTRTKHRLDRWEGGVLVLLYFLFILLEMI